jgi:hypothetical protein
MSLLHETPLISTTTHSGPLSFAKVDLARRTLWNHNMDLFDAIKLRDAAEVSRLVSLRSDVNATNRSGLTVVQFAAVEYCSQISLVSTTEAQELRRKWADIIDPLVETNSLVAKKITSEACNSESLDDIPTALELNVDAMLHELGYFKSELAVQMEYAPGLLSDRVEGKGWSLPDLFPQNLRSRGILK